MKITLEIRDGQIYMAFNKPNYTYQFLTMEEGEEIWQKLLDLTYELRKAETIRKVAN